jgi:hypothetical protein
MWRWNSGLTSPNIGQTQMVIGQTCWAFKTDGLILEEWPMCWSVRKSARMIFLLPKSHETYINGLWFDPSKSAWLHVNIPCLMSVFVGQPRSEYIYMCVADQPPIFWLVNWHQLQPRNYQTSAASIPDMIDSGKSTGNCLMILYGSVSKPCAPGEHQNSW